MKQGAQKAKVPFRVSFRHVKSALTTCILICLLSFPVSGGTPETRWEVKEPFNQKFFIENKGQFELPDSLQAGKILFGARMDGLVYYFTPKGVWVKYLNYANQKAEEEEESSKNESEEEREEKEAAPQEQFHALRFPGSSDSVSISGQELVGEHFFFGTPATGDIQAGAYKQLVYRNIYQGIDLEFHFPKDSAGFKYSFTLQPGANPALIRMAYPLSQTMRHTSRGNLFIESAFGTFTDHHPSAVETGTGKPVACTFFVNKGEVSFATGKYDASQSLLIDPWTTTPLAFTSGNGAYDVDWDVAGNCYIYGGAFPFQVIKYSPSGTPLWTYTTNFTGTKKRYGDFAVDHRSGSVYIVEGYNSVTGSSIIKLTSGGVPVGFFRGDLSFTEMWRISFSSCTNQLVIAGGGVTSPSYTACYVDTSLINLSPVNVLNSPTGYHDMWGVAADNAGNCYMATARSASDPGNYDNILYSLPLPALAPINWQAASGYQFVETYAVSYTPGSITGYSNGYNGMAMGGSGLYTYDSHVLNKWNTAGGTLTGSATVNGAVIKNARRYGGITADDCDHVFLGLEKNILQYNSLTPAGTITASDTVYDLSLGTNNLLYACGRGFVSCISVNLPSCTAIKVTNHVQSCVSPASDSLSITGGKAPYNITWNTNPVQTGFVAINLAPGTYIATIQDDACNMNVAHDTVVIPPATVGTIVPLTTPVACNGGSDGSVSLQVTGAPPPLPVFTWSNGATGQSVNHLTAGTYTVSITGSNGCVQSLPILITQPAPIKDSLITRPTHCFGDTAGMAVNINGGTPTYQITWNSNPPQTGFNAQGLQAGIYTGTVTDGHGCKTTFTAQLTEPPQLIVTATAIDTGCSGNSGKASASATGGTGAYTYSWNPGGGSSASLSGLAPGNYTVTVTDSNGCATQTTTALVAPPPLQVSFTSIDSAGCSPVCVYFSANVPPSAIVIWNFGDQNASNLQQPSHCYKSPGNYSVTLTATKGNCTQVVTHPNMVTVYPHPNAAFQMVPSGGNTPAGSTCFSHPSTLDSGTTVSYAWNFGDFDHNTSTEQNPCFVYANPGKYCANLTVTNTFGCRDSSELCTDIVGEVELFVPNSFTPNGDGTNDLFLPVGEGIDPSHFDFIVYDRWGQLLWETTEWGKGWDGRVKGSVDIVQQDVYIWKIDCEDINGHPHHLIGHVTVIK